MPQSAPSKAAAQTSSRSSATDRAQAAAAEEIALQTALETRDIQATARLVVAGSSTRVRQAAAEGIDDPEVLRQLIRDVRGGNDKSVYKILTSKRDALVERARQLEQLQASIGEASEALERHSRRPYDALFSPRLDELEGRWQALAAQAGPELRDRVQRWIDLSRETAAEHLRQVAAQAAREQAAASEAAEARRLRDEQAQASAEAAAERARMLEEQRRVAAEQQEAEQQAFRQIAELIRKARLALGDGSSSRAAAVRKTIEDKLAGAPPLPANLAGQILQLDQQLEELKDWKRFSVAPKRVELIEEMESLVGDASDPLVLAEKIKRLQDQWRALSKGTGENLEAEWQRFQAAAQKAFQPCSEYFAAKALVREETLRQRDALLARLTALEATTNWEQPDWRDLIKTLREVKLEWRGCGPVDSKAARTRQESYAALTAGLQARVDAEYARNLKHKELLIERARALLGSDDGRKAIDAIKELQEQWRLVGPVPREADQRLWGEFRQHCDGVFQKRQQESAAYSATLEHNKAQAMAVCEQVEAIAALEGAELLAGAGALPELRRAFEALGEFPRAETRELRTRYERALERCDRALARQRERDAVSAWDELFEAASKVRSYRLARVRGAEAAELERLKQSAEAGMSAVRRWPKGGLEALKKALAEEGAADLAVNEAALRMLCVRAEILSEQPTPPEDQALRREYQLQRLVQNMGQGGRTDDARLDTLSIEWVRVGPVDEAVYQGLLQRFRRCREPGRARG